MGIKHACKTCEDRYPGCHDKCEKYKAEKEESAKIYMNRRKDILAPSTLARLGRERKNKNLKRYGKR